MQQRARSIDEAKKTVELAASKTTKARSALAEEIPKQSVGRKT